MIRALEPDPDPVIAEQVTTSSVSRVNIGRIDLQQLTGKRAKDVIVSK